MVFALVSLCLAVVPIVFFINHRYDGVQLWNVQGVPGVHEAVWLVNFVSFYFLYPSTFNILEVGAHLIGKLVCCGACFTRVLGAVCSALCASV